MSFTSKIFSLFVADDFVIYGISGVIVEGNNLVLREPIASRLQRSDDLEKDVAEAIAQTARLIDFSNISSVTVSIFGPIRHINGGHGPMGMLKPSKRLKISAPIDIHAIIKQSIESKRSSYNPSYPPISVYTDAEAFAVGEYYLRKQPDSNTNVAARLGDSLAYILADEGIGAAVMSNHAIQRGASHLEAGHISVARWRSDKNESATCMHGHNDCIEALASLSAMRERWSLDVDEVAVLPPSSERLKAVAFYLSQLVRALILIMAPSQIVVGGRIAMNPALTPLLRGFLKRQLSCPNGTIFPGYAHASDLADFIRAPLTRDSGVYGGFFLAAQALGRGPYGGNVIQLRSRLMR